MNIHGYKKKKKSITRLLAKEFGKPSKERCQEKINRLRTAKHRCQKKIDELRKLKEYTKKVKKN